MSKRPMTYDGSSSTMLNAFPAKRTPPPLASGYGLSITIHRRPQGITDVVGSTDNNGVREVLLKPLKFAFVSALKVWRHDATKIPGAPDPTPELKRKAHTEGIQVQVVEAGGNPLPKVSAVALLNGLSGGGGGYSGANGGSSSSAYRNPANGGAGPSCSTTSSSSQAAAAGYDDLCLPDDVLAAMCESPATQQATRNPAAPQPLLQPPLQSHQQWSHHSAPPPQPPQGGVANNVPPPASSSQFSYDGMCLPDDVLYRLLDEAPQRR